MTQPLSRLLIFAALVVATGCPEKRAAEVVDSGPPAPVAFTPPRDPVLANRPPRPLDAKYLLGPGDIAKLHVRGGMGPQPIAGKPPTSPSYDGVRYVAAAPGPGVSVEWQAFPTPQAVAQRFQASIHEQPKARMLPAVGPLALALSTHPEELVLVFADPPTHSVVSISCGQPVCTVLPDAGIDDASLDTLVGLAKVAQEHLSKPLPP
ncbi:MAG: hypothetical protein JST54_16645 [Deltaproteobacteria bacterium]|nr:hypothetical protein [Deltaproteobacteria bacterium]